MNRNLGAANSNELEATQWVQLVQEMVKKTEYGVVQLVIHNARVVRLERTEKVVLDGTRTSPA
jgi:hypothetical protein